MSKIVIHRTKYFKPTKRNHLADALRRLTALYENHKNKGLLWIAVDEMNNCLDIY
jgi:hypothetical protein